MERLDAVVDVLAASGLTDTAAQRALLIDVLETVLPVPPTIAEHPVMRAHLIALVRGCDRTVGGMAALIRAVRVFSPTAAAELDRALMAPPPVADLFDVAALDRVGRLLDTATVGSPRAMAHRSGATLLPGLGSVETLRQALVMLADVTTGVHGLPPALALVELVAAGDVTPELRRALRSWSDEQAQVLSCENKLAAFRPQTRSLVPSHDEQLVLMIMIAPIPDEVGWYALYSWQEMQPDQWPPRREDGPRIALNAADGPSGLEALRRAIERIVFAAERSWRRYDGQVFVELVVPRELLNLPFDRWSLSPDGLVQLILGLRYPVVLRSYERMRHPEWHRPLWARWKDLDSEPEETRWHQASTVSARQRHVVEAALGDMRACMLLVLPQPPTTVTPAGEDCLGWVLSTGLPGMAWTRSPHSAEATGHTIAWMFEQHSMVVTPLRIHRLRRDAVGEQPTQPAPATGRDLALLWDTPHRMIDMFTHVRFDQAVSEQ